MLRMEHLHKVFRTDYIETHALDDFNLYAEHGDFLAVMGPSGSGKSTFLNVAGLLENYDQGVYYFDGEDVSGMNDAHLSRLRNRKIGFIFQSFNLIPQFTVFENVELPLRYAGFNRRERRLRIEEALATVGLSGRTKHRPDQLSGGQQQRVAIARAIAGLPSLILADEPTGNLDTAMAQQIMELLAKINETGTTIVMVTHDPELAQHAKRNIHILDGKVIDLSSGGTAPPLLFKTNPAATH